MIFDNIKNYKNYEKLNSKFEKAFQFLLRDDLKVLPVGRYEIEGNEVFALIQEYETKDLESKLYEAHKKYIDVQYMVEGEENMGFILLDNLSVKTQYDEEKDAMLLDGERRLYKLKPEELFVFFPEEPHMPGVLVDKSSKVKKVVIKIRA